MVFKNKKFNKFWRFSCSFQLGIPILVAIAVLTAWGTIVEAQFDAFAAKKIVFDSWMMWVAFSLLVYNLTVVVVDRWPWKLNHYPFITVHAGIIILIFGGWLTNRYGTDGQITVPIMGKNNLISVPNIDFVVYATFDGDRYTKVYDREVDFFSTPPTKEKPYVVSLGDDQFQVIDYVKYANLKTLVKKSDDLQAGASVRFQLTNANVKQVQQVTQSKKDKEAFFNLGPAKVILGPVQDSNSHANEIYVTPVNAEKIKYTIFHKDNPLKAFKTGEMKIGDVVDTGWMGLQFRLLDYLPQAVEDYEVTALEKPTPMTVAAIKIKHLDHEKWLALNDLVKLFGKSSAYLVSYQNRRIDLGFQILLNNFEVTRYHGTMKAKEYASQVSVGRVGENLLDASKVDQSALISMNEPMKYNGYTIYQASFQEDEMTGKPVASVFSVNKDPGRPTKYIGSIVLSLGIVWLFYQRRKRATST